MLTNETERQEPHRHTKKHVAAVVLQLGTHSRSRRVPASVSRDGCSAAGDKAGLAAFHVVVSVAACRPPA